MSALLMAVSGVVRRPSGVLIGASTIVLCLGLLGIETDASLGPGGARLPFCIAFLGYQAALTAVDFVVLRGVAHPIASRSRGCPPIQFSFRALVGSTTALAIVFAISGYLIRAESDPLVVGAVWLTGCGLVAVALALTNLGSAKHNPTNPSEHRSRAVQ